MTWPWRRVHGPLRDGQPVAREELRHTSGQVCRTCGGTNGRGNLYRYKVGDVIQPGYYCSAACWRRVSKV